MTTVHYALQVCDRGNSQNITRYCSNSKKEVIRKCVTSFFNSVLYTARQRTNSLHIIRIFDDMSSVDTIIFLQRCIDHYKCNNVQIDLVQLNGVGIMKSIKYCYEWLRDEGEDIVYQVQDDYLFEETAVFEMIDVIFQLINDLNTHAIVYPFNFGKHWLDIYRYKSTPRVFFPAAKRYWIQLYDIACTFMTTRDQFNKNWKYLEIFFNLKADNQQLESCSLNKMFVENNVLGVQPVESIALHMQSELEKDPFINWKSRWDKITPL